MDKNTFNDPQVSKLLNEKFYAVKFNAEQREDVVFDNHTFKFVPSGRNGYHELAAALLNNQLSYPTVVFLDEEFKMIQPLAGYRQAPEFHISPSSSAKVTTKPSNGTSGRRNTNLLIRI